MRIRASLRSSVESPGRDKVEERNYAVSYSLKPQRHLTTVYNILP